MRRSWWDRRKAAKEAARQKFATQGRRKTMLIGYTRCSTKDQVDGSTIAEQERMIRGIAMIRGIDQFDIVFYSDPAVSGSISLKRRPQGEEMMANLKKGDIIIAAKLDRLFRSASDALYVVETLQERGIGIILADMGHTPVTENGASKLFFSMLAAFAEFERVRIQERTTSGRDAKKALSGCVGSVPYGWYKRGHGRGSHLVENFDEQKVIAAVVKYRSQGMTYQDIANLLTSERCLNRVGMPFNRGQLHDMVKRAISEPRDKEVA
jgi:DNA invertase Pin-like site-specific DNA recombinase